MILVRSDGTPTFMLSVVVDDHDMGVTHVVRGDDHLTNTFRHINIYNAFGWEMPQYGHIPLIHGPDGTKLSKRHGALGVESYKDMGFLPETICNCLLRLGWSHGDDEIMSMQQAIQWFTTENLGKSPARLDFMKLENLNRHYMKEADNKRLLEDLINNGLIDASSVPEERINRLLAGMNGLKQRSKTLLEIKDMASIYLDDFEPITVEKSLADIAKQVYDELFSIDIGLWTEENLERTLRGFATNIDVSFGKIAQMLRNAMTGKKITPSIFEMLVAFGKKESLRRLEKVL
jgi:glutamyl-tRNA synthetase